MIVFTVITEDNIFHIFQYACIVWINAILEISDNNSFMDERSVEDETFSSSWQPSSEVEEDVAFSFPCIC